MKTKLVRFIQGIIIGFATIAAVGGGTIAVLLGIYDEMITAVSNFTKEPKKSFAYLWPIGLGILIGVGGLIIPINFLLQKWPLITTSLFVGLTIGGLSVFGEFTKGKATKLNIFFLIIGIIFVAAIGIFSWFNAGASNLNAVTWGQIGILFIVGFFASAALVAPGISGTLFLISIGYFKELVELIKRVLLFRSTNMGMDFLGVLSFGIGIIIGFFAISKMVKFFLDRYRNATYFTILGLIIGSIFICYFNGDIRPEYLSLFKDTTLNITLTMLISVVALIVGTLLSFYLLRYARKKNIGTTINESTVHEN